MLEPYSREGLINKILKRVHDRNAGQDLINAS